jgi:hypothetical protein|tara:strand:+ start:80 stop:205 length:126 start_codon:yes stop_codon:yes gene_type:complete
MIKKLILIFVCFSLFLSCGKKSAPEYENKDGSIKEFIEKKK